MDKSSRGEFLLEGPDEFRGEFHNLEIEIGANPAGDVYLTYKFNVRSEKRKVLVPVAGFKSEYLPIIEALPLPISVKTEKIDPEVLVLSIKDSLQRPKSCKHKVYQLYNGNKGIYWELPSGKEEYSIFLLCRLPGFLRFAPFGVELVIGIFPPLGWKRGPATISFKGSLLTSTWGHKMIAGVHDIDTGDRLPGGRWPLRFFRGRLKPPLPKPLPKRYWLVPFKRAIIPSFKSGNLLYWGEILKGSELGPNQEVRLRVHGARFKLLALSSPLAPFWFLVLLIILALFL